jgi:hypothetical protein
VARKSGVTRAASVSVDGGSGALEKEVAAEAKTPARAKVPLDARASESRDDQGVSGANVGGERDNKRDIEVSDALEKSAVKGGDGDADASARKAQTRDYADAQTPKDVKKIAWQTADGSSERVTRKSSRSVKRAGVPASVAKANAEKASEDAALAKDAQIAQSSSVDKKKRAKARANGLAFLKADIPALTINATTAGGEIVSTELKISPRTLAARKAKEEAKALGAQAQVRTTVAALHQPAQASDSAPKQQPVDQRSLMESFMIQPEINALASAVPVPFAPRVTPAAAPTPSQIKAIESLRLHTPSGETLAERQKGRLPASIAPVSISEASDVMSRLKRAMEARSRADEENKRRLESQLRQKEEERRLREQEMNARKALQASNEARELEERRLRQQRLMEIRSAEEEIQRKAALEKSKFNQMLEDQKRMTALPSSNLLKRPFHTQSGYQYASSDAEKRRRLLENAQAAIHGHHAALSPSATVYAKQQSSVMRTPTRSIFKTNFASSSTYSSYNQTNDESYVISPYASSDDEDEDKPRKVIPSWARGAALVPQLKAQSYVDPDDIFPNPSLTCSLGKIFKKPGHDRRRSSSNWSHDRLTLKEELSYKQQMGFR